MWGGSTHSSYDARAHWRGFSFDHGLGDFVREFDAGRYPGLVAGS
jgi:hypothetical protein